MVKKIKKGKKVFMCEECSMKYEDEPIAKKCEEWCRKHHSCNVEITRNAVE
ncbi:MAG TPA: hypothetical protein VJI46_06055 [Candidatus Nanoarchaeia archaeon]|nr:hypothetical protein [Candidatus Nanoarchaeia archaeon]